jgi:hypothetical protein
MKTDKEIIDDMLFKTDIKTLENGPIEDIGGFINKVLAHALVEQGFVADEEE